MSEMAGKVPVCANLFPSGEYLMEDFYFAGGLPALLKKLEAHLDWSALTVNGRTLGENLAGAECWNDEVIRDPTNPVVPLSRGKTLAVLRGNLAPERRGHEILRRQPAIPASTSARPSCSTARRR